MPSTSEIQQRAGLRGAFVVWNGADFDVVTGYGRHLRAQQTLQLG